ncbi:hypothetical protein Y981_04515 [Leptospirillum ferriphilum YSK]|uniref:Uncharacterized protein n=1 Tax=Leptospirillum ferriphilum YSK TaxID=1441628 RepID=A0A059Y220_9BACT|nr:hypothetical protein Y981_04515 [Leptospirillum ferriphilum YSK]
MAEGTINLFPVFPLSCLSGREALFFEGLLFLRSGIGSKTDPGYCYGILPKKAERSLPEIEQGRVWTNGNGRNLFP